MAPKGNKALSEQDVQVIEQAAFEVISKQLTQQKLDEAFFLLAVDFEKDMGHWFLRVYIDRKKLDRKMMLEDCEVISRLIDEPIETLKALGDLRYNLEVSSPGLFRSLQKKREFDFYLNQPVQVKYKDEETSKEGYLGNFDDARQTFELKPAPDTEGYDVKLDKGVLVYLNPPITVLEMSNS